MILHQALDELLAGFLAEHPDKRPSTTTVLELLEWSAARGADAPPPDGVRCARCQQFLSETRREMRIRFCSACDGHGPRRRR